MIDEALEVALEHARWARSQGLTPPAVMAAVGRRVPFCQWGDVVTRLADEWRAMRLTRRSGPRTIL